MRHKVLVLTAKKWLKSAYIYGGYRKIKTQVGPTTFWTTLCNSAIGVYKNEAKDHCEGLNCRIADITNLELLQRVRRSIVQRSHQDRYSDCSC